MHASFEPSVFGHTRSDQSKSCMLRTHNMHNDVLYVSHTPRHPYGYTVSGLGAENVPSPEESEPMTFAIAHQCYELRSKGIQDEAIVLGLRSLPFGGVPRSALLPTAS